MTKRLIGQSLSQAWMTIMWYIRNCRTILLFSDTGEWHSRIPMTDEFPMVTLHKGASESYNVLDWQKVAVKHVFQHYMKAFYHLTVSDIGILLSGFTSDCDVLFSVWIKLNNILVMLNLKCEFRVSWNSYDPLLLFSNRADLSFRCLRLQWSSVDISMFPSATCQLIVSCLDVIYSMLDISSERIMFCGRLSLIHLILEVDKSTIEG